MISHEEPIKFIKKKKLILHESEIKMLELIRKMRYGEVKVKVQDGLPVYYTEIQKNKKLV